MGKFNRSGSATKDKISISTPTIGSTLTNRATTILRANSFGERPCLKRAINLFQQIFKKGIIFLKSYHG